MRRSGAALKLVLGAFWLAAVVFPLGRMFSGMAGVDVRAVVTAPRFLRALRQSLAAAGTAAVIAVALAGALAWCVARTGLRRKGLVSALLTVPMLIPSISHGMGLIIILGANGWLTRLLGLSGSIYGFRGIVAGAVLYAFPVAYLMLLDVLRYEDGAPYEAAAVLGLGPWDRLRAVTLPYLRRPLISVFFAAFTMIVTDYGVPLMVGGKYLTLPVMLYQDVIGMLDFGKGSVIGAVLLAPALIACVLDIANRDRGGGAFVRRPYPVRENRARDAVAAAFCGAVIVLSLLPIASFAVLGFLRSYPIDTAFSLENAAQALRMGAGRCLKNSLLIACAAALAGTALAAVCAYETVRRRSMAGRALHLASVSPLAIPGLVLGLAYAMTFRATPLSGSFSILILANAVHFFASPYLMACNAFGKLNENLEAVGATLGVPRRRIVRDVILPQCAPTLLEMAGYFFVNSMMTISAVSFLASVGTKPLALMIPQFEGQVLLEPAAFVSLLILAVNLAAKALVSAGKRRKSA